ncbi:MAG: hypothetical protein AMXMBFR34_05510 [Myxococcaceae bacterium]
MSPRVAALLLLLDAQPALAAEFRGGARLWAGAGVDTNARRDYTSPDVPTQPDGFFFGLLHLQGVSLFAETVRVAGTYDLAGRKFLTLATEDTLVQDGSLEAAVGIARSVEVGVLGRVRDRRGAERNYTDLTGGVLVDFLPTDALDVRLTFGAHRFLYWERFEYSYYGPEGVASIRYRFTRRHSLSVFGSFIPRTYNAAARPPPDVMPVPDAQVRFDSYFTVGAGYSYRGPFHLSVGYAYFDQSSNSYGESIRRHRVSVTGGFQLPWELTLLTALTAQFSAFPQGVYLSPDLTVVEDDENASSLTVKLVRPIIKYVELDLRYAGYLNFLPQNSFLYLRHVISLGLAVAIP